MICINFQRSAARNTYWVYWPICHVHIGEISTIFILELQMLKILIEAKYIGNDWTPYAVSRKIVL